ncbi:MAG: oligosaccharide flippase family protein [Clostridia bacterium]|nr:oligosaccharide flippase family protein [Clostridia bacterium]
MAGVVTVLSICERALGFLYRIILSRTIGSEGMGIYQLALSIFAVFITLTSSGIPITVSRLLAKYKAKQNLRAERQTVTAAVCLTLAFALPIFFLLYFGHGFLDLLFSDERCTQVFLILLFGFVFDSVYSVVRGSFWGNKQFLAYSVIEFIEESVMIAVGSILLVHMTDLLDGARRAAFAVVISYITSFTIAMIYFFVKGGKFVNPYGQFKPLLSSAMPITAMRTSTSLTNSLVSVLIPARLILGGMTAAEAMSEYGVVLGMAIPILYTPATIIGSIALVLTPELSDSFYRNQHERLKNNIEKALKVTVLIACTLMPVFFVLGEDMGMLLFSSPRSGEIIKNCCMMLLPMTLNMITTSMLNSLGCEKHTLINFFFGAAAMLACVWFLPPYIGIYGLCVGQIADHIICSVLNLRLLHKKCVKKPVYLRFLLKIVAITLPEAALGVIIYPNLLKIMNVWLAMMICAAAMLVMQAALLWITGTHKTFIREKREEKLSLNAVKSV